MKKIIGYLVHFFKYECSKPALIAIILFTGLLTFINYRYNVEILYIRSDQNAWLQYGLYFAMYLLAFGGGYLIEILFGKNKGKYRLVSAGLWMSVIYAAAAFAVRAAYSYYGFLQDVDAPYFNMAHKYTYNLLGFMFMFIPGFIYWLIMDRKNQPVYGFHSKGVTLWPYWAMLGIMLPVIIMSAISFDFLEYYPRAESLYLPPNDNKHWLYLGLYELLYATDFIWTEFFFRGFLILGFIRFAGPKAILPMAVFYVTIHFDKPMMEAVSSFFGAILLGVIAYRSKSIYGGIIVHIGIAMMMELVAFLFKYVF